MNLVSSFHSYTSGHCFGPDWCELKYICSRAVLYHIFPNVCNFEHGFYHIHSCPVFPVYDRFYVHPNPYFVSYLSEKQ